MNIYGNNIDYLIGSSVELMKEQHEREKRKLIRKFLDYYEGDMTEKYIADKFSAKAFQEVDPVCMNITKRFIDRMSRVYTLGASRTLPSQNDIYSSLTRFKDLKMKHLERMTLLLFKQRMKWMTMAYLILITILYIILKCSQMK